MKRIHIACLMLVLLAAVFCLAGGAQAAGSATVVASGDCGAEAGQLAWTLYSDGEMVITASGSSASSYVYMANYDAAAERPWASRVSAIKTLRFAGTGQVKIGNGAFQSCTALTSADLQGVSDVGDSAFEGCSALTTVYFPEARIDLWEKAFRNCGNLKNVTNANKIYLIGEYCFENCASLESIVLQGSYMSEGAFKGCTGLGSLTMSGGDLSRSVFENCTSLTEVTIPERVYSVPDAAFKGCVNLKTVTFGEDDCRLGDRAFEGCAKLEQLVNLSGHNSVGAYTFSGCAKLQALPFTCYNVSEGGLMNCTALTGLVFEGAQFIGKDAFSGCTALSSVNFNDESVPVIYPNAFKNVTASIRYPALAAWTSQIDNYGGSLTWNGYDITLNTNGFNGSEGNITWSFSEKTGILTIEGTGDMGIYTVVQHEDYDPPVADCDGNLVSPGGRITWEERICSKPPWLRYTELITKVVIGNGITSIMENAFSNCTHLKEVTYPASLVRIEKGAFRLCQSLKQGYFPEGVLEIPDEVYAGCNQLESIVIPEGVQSIGENAFAGCSSLTEINIPDSVKTIKYSAFLDSGLEQVTLGKNVERIEGQAFYQTPIQFLRLPSSVKYLDSVFDIPELYFEGNVPEPVYFLGTNTKVTIWYPQGNASWESYINEHSSLSATFKPYGAEETVDIYRCTFTLDERGFVYDGTEKTPGVTGYYGETPLTAGTHYTLSYSDNVNAGSGTVTITGKGRYQGEVILSFEIARAEPSLSFASNSVTKEVGEGAFTNALTKTTDGTVTYTSSDPAVATVASGTGRVTVVGEGTAIITANAAQGRNYAAGSASFTLVVYNPTSVQPLSWEDFSFAILNGQGANEADHGFSSFNYESGYLIPEERFEFIYSPIIAKIMFNMTYDNGKRLAQWDGSCFGFSSASVLLNNSGNDLKLSDFGRSKTYNLRLADRNSRYSLTLLQILESLQVSQWDYNLAQAEQKHSGDIAGLCNEVEAAKTNHRYPVIAIYWKGGGHAMVGYDLVHYDATTDYLYVYDPNFPYSTIQKTRDIDAKRHITLKKNAAGKYVSWYYKFNEGYSGAVNCGTNYAGCSIAYTPYAYIESMWKNKGNLSYQKTNLLMVGSDSFAIYDYADNLLATMDHGVFASNRNNIFAMDRLDEGNDPGALVYLPTDMYKIVNGEEGVLKVGMVNQNQSAEVETTAPSVIVTVSDEDLINQVEVEGFEGDQYCVTLNSALPGDEDISEVQFSGRSSGVNLTVGVCGHDFILNNCPGVSLLVKGQMMAIPGDTDRKNVASYNFALEYTACVYDGTAKMPGVKTLDDYNLKQNVDYVVSYENNTQVGTAKATVWGVDAYMGSVVLNFDIVATEVDLCPNDHMWDEGVITQAPTLLRDGNITYTCSVCGTKKVENFPGLYYYQVSRTGSAVTVSLTNNTNDKVTALFCLAAYDVTGRMTDLRVINGPAATSHITI